MLDAQSFQFTHRGQELSANDTIWASAIATDCSLMRCQDQPDIRRDKLLERLINIGVYDHRERLDLNDDLAEKRSFQYVAVLTNILWDQVHDLESKVAFALVLCCHSTEQLLRTFIALSRCKALITPSNISVVGWLITSVVTRNIGQCRRPPCTRSSRTARPRQVDIGMRQPVSGTRVAPRLVSSMPFRVCLKLIEVAIDCRVPPLPREGQGLACEYL
jgi:hypothetical protein